MFTWLARAGAALRIGADRADLWPAGALAWLAYLGWLPLILVVAPPDGDALEAFGVSLYLSQSFPLNVAMLAAAMVVGFSALCLLVAAAEVGLQELAAGARHSSPSRTTLSAFAIVLLASLPVLALLVVVAYGVIAVAPAEYLSSDIGTPVLLRIAAHVVPQLVAAAIVLVVVQALAAVARRQVVTVPARTAMGAIGVALREVRHRPAATIGLSLLATLADAVVLVVEVAVLRVLWSPIAIGLGDGLLTRPGTIPLLLGFVAIWLGLLLASGALHVAVSAWWALQLGERWRQAPVSDPPRPVAGSQTGGPQ